MEQEREWEGQAQAQTQPPGGFVHAARFEGEIARGGELERRALALGDEVKSLRKLVAKLEADVLELEKGNSELDLELTNAHEAIVEAQAKRDARHFEKVRELVRAAA